MASGTENRGGLLDILAIFGATIFSFLFLKLALAIWGLLKAFVFAKPFGLTADFRGMGQWAGKAMHYFVPY